MLKKILYIAVILLSLPASASEISRYTLSQPYDAPEIQFTDAANSIHNLSDYKGKVVLLNFWATWCEPCVHEIPALEGLAEFMTGKNVAIIPVAIDLKGIDVVQKFYDEHKISTLPMFLDNNGKAFREYKLEALPTTVIIDRKGQVIAKILGEIDWNSQEVRDYLLQAGR